jgi:hypothetical protein
VSLHKDRLTISSRRQGRLDFQMRIQQIDCGLFCPRCFGCDHSYFSTSSRRSASRRRLLIALDVSTENLNPGQTFTFSGAITNDAQSTVDLNGIDVTLDGSMFQVDPSPFFSGPPTVAAGTSTPSFTLFSVTVDLPYNASPGDTDGNTDVPRRSRCQQYL